MDKIQLRSLISSVLQNFDSEMLFSDDAVNLLLGTAAVESLFGYYITQVGGPAKGIFQMEPATEKDIWENWLKYQGELSVRMRIRGYTGPDPEKLLYDLQYQILMARFHYRRVRDAIPPTLLGQAKYWKEHYNTYLGAGTICKYMEAYAKYVV